MCLTGLILMPDCISVHAQERGWLSDPPNSSEITRGTPNAAGGITAYCNINGTSQTSAEATNASLDPDFRTVSDSCCHIEHHWVVHRNASSPQEG